MNESTIHASASTGRRDFLKRTTATAMLGAASYGRAIGANERLSLGLIGCGHRGNDHLRDVFRYSEEANVQLTALCDAWRRRLADTADHVEDFYQAKPRVTEYYEELLALDDIDAVIIASPDHQHPIQLRDAAHAGKDAYVEKPLAIRLDHLLEAYVAVKETSRVVQCGTQLRSYGSFTACRQFVQEGGLGDVVKIDQRRDSYEPYWYRYVEPMERADVNWEAFLMHEQGIEWNSKVCSGWYGYRPFSNGPFGGLMTHFVDLAHYITGAHLPHAAVAMGGEYSWKDDFTAPNNVYALLEYPEGFLVSYSTMTGVPSKTETRAHGRRGTLNMDNWNAPSISGAGSGDENRIPEERPLEPVARDQHMLDWLKCLRSRETPNADIESGFAHSIAAIMADEALLKGCRVMYDSERREIRAG